MSMNPPANWKPEGLRTWVRTPGPAMARRRRRTACMISCWDRLLRKAAPGSPASTPRNSRPTENTRSWWGARPTYMRASFTEPRKEPPTLASTRRTPGTRCTSAATSRTSFSMAGRLVP